MRLAFVNASSPALATFPSASITARRSSPRPLIASLEIAVKSGLADIAASKIWSEDRITALAEVA